MTEANFSIFSGLLHHKSQKIMTYYSIAYGLLTCLWQQKTVDIKLPVPVIDAKTMLTFSTLRKLDHTFQGLKNQKTNFGTFQDTWDPWLHCLQNCTELCQCQCQWWVTNSWQQSKPVPQSPYHFTVWN